MRICVWWYSSLLFSLLSAFIGLLSKQWIVRYRGRAEWAETLAMKSRVRELRYQGLGTWQFHHIMEIITIFLQISLLLFVVGLVEYLRPTSLTLSYIVLSFLVFGLCFYVLTVTAGIIYPSCPFKTPLSQFLYDWWMHVDALGRWVVLAIELFLHEAYCYLRPSRVCHSATVLRLKLAQAWDQLPDRDVIAAYEGEFGERNQVEKNCKVEADAGIYCWALQLGEDFASVRDAAAKVVMDMGLEEVIKAVEVFRRGGMLDSWSQDVAARMLQGDEPSPSTVLQGNALFHLMHHSPLAHRIASVHLLPSRRRGGIWADGNNLVQYIRQTNRQPDGLVDISTFSLPTLSLYIQASLRLSTFPHWKAPTYLQDDLRELFQHPRALQAVGEDNAVVLSSMVLVDRSETKDNKMVTWTGAPFERVTRALHRLSFFPDNFMSEESYTATLHTIIPLLTYTNPSEADQNLLHVKKQVLKTEYLKNGQLVEALIRLLHRSAFWVNSSLREVSLVLACPFILGSASIDSLPGVFKLVEPQGVKSIFSLFAYHFDPHDAELVLCLLDVVLGLRHRRHGPRLRRLGHLRMRTNSMFREALHEYPQVVRGFIEVIQQEPESRRYVLSALVKGRDLFFPEAETQNPQLHQMLESLAKSFLSSNDVYNPLPGYAFVTFDMWDAVVVELQKLEMSLVAPLGASTFQQMEMETQGQWPAEISLAHTPILTPASYLRELAIRSHTPNSFIRHPQPSIVTPATQISPTLYSSPVSTTSLSLPAPSIHNGTRPSLRAASLDSSLQIRGISRL